MSKKSSHPTITDPLFNRIVAILEEAKNHVVRVVNSSMIIAYWLIGRELVETIQKGDERAEYGKEIVNQLSTQLNNKFGKGFSTTNLSYFRQFYLTYADRAPEIQPVSTDNKLSEILHKPCGKSGANEKGVSDDVLDDLTTAVEKSDIIKGFSPSLSWSHYHVHPGEIFADVLMDRATSLIIAHNHPSGNLQPSREDIDVTRKIADAARVLGLKLLDHIIFSKKGYYSCLENERLNGF